MCVGQLAQVVVGVVGSRTENNSKRKKRGKRGAKKEREKNLSVADRLHWSVRAIISKALHNTFQSDYQPYNTIIIIACKIFYLCIMYWSW